MTAAALKLPVPLNVLHAHVVRNRVDCAGLSVIAFAYPVYIMCRLLASSDLPDSPVDFRWAGDPVTCFVESFREVARWTPGRDKWVRS